MDSAIAYLDRADAPRLAYRHRPGTGPTFVYLPGYGSDMEGAKALAVDAWAARQGRPCLRFDNQGCGASGGDFLEGTVGRWTQDVLDLIAALVSGPLVLTGSSLGGWTALLAARALGPQVAALVLIAPAPDFTQWDLVEKLTSEERAALAKQGWFERADAAPEPPTRYSRALIEDGPAHILLGGEIAFAGAARILHGQRDAVVPWARSIDLAAHLASADVHLTLVKDGDHRLSRTSDLALLTATLEALPV